MTPKRPLDKILKPLIYHLLVVDLWFLIIMFTQYINSFISTQARSSHGSVRLKKLLLLYFLILGNVLIWTYRPCVKSDRVGWFRPITNDHLTELAANILRGSMVLKVDWSICSHCGIWIEIWNWFGVGMRKLKRSE